MRKTNCCFLHRLNLQIFKAQLYMILVMYKVFNIWVHLTVLN